MPVPPVLPYCAAGVKTDLETLLSRFTETQSVRYEEFAKVWREMQLPLIFYGRQDMRDLWMFVEELFSIALNYVLPPYSFQIRVGGLYIMYGLFFKQPNDPKIKFRVTQETWKTLLEFVEEAQSQSHLDVVYVFLKLRYYRAFHFTVTAGQYDPLLKETTEGEDKNTLDDTDTFSHNLLGDLFDSSNVDHLAEVHDQYHRLKCVLGGPNATKPDPDIDMIHSNLVHNITKIVAGYEEYKKTGKKPKRKRRDSGGVTTSESEGDSDSELPSSSGRTRSQGSIRQEIKARAFAGTPEKTRDRRHRVVNLEASPSPQKKTKEAVVDNLPEDEETQSMSSDLRTHLRSAILNMPSSFEEINTDATLVLSPGVSPKKGRKKRQRHSSESADMSKKKWKEGKDVSQEETIAKKSPKQSPVASKPKQKSKKHETFAGETQQKKDMAVKDKKIGKHVDDKNKTQDTPKKNLKLKTKTKKNSSDMSDREITDSTSLENVTETNKKTKTKTKVVKPKEDNAVTSPRQLRKHDQQKSPDQNETGPLIHRRKQESPQKR